MLEKLKIKSLKAFTLAEVLMVMAILGVVASLTIPNLKDNADEQVFVSQAKKIYAEIQTAFSRASLKYGNSQNWWKTSAPSRMSEFMDVTLDCGTSSGGSINVACWGGDSCINNGARFILLKSGASLCYPTNETSATFVRFDINGPNEPNGPGYDQFDIYHITDALDSKLEPYSAVPATNAQPGAANYLGWVLNYSNEDYFRCASNLKWFSSNTSCN